MLRSDDDESRLAQVMRNCPVTIRDQIRGMSSPSRIYGLQVRPLCADSSYVSVVLLIACVNALAAARAGHPPPRGIRDPSGSGRRRSAVVRESVFEGLLLGAAGGLLGLGFAALIVRAALQLLPESMPRIDSISLDWTVVSFGLLVALATGALCSFAPAFTALKVNLTESLKENARTGSTPHARLRSALVVSEIAIALVLVTTSGAFCPAPEDAAVDPGFRPDHVLSALYLLPRSNIQRPPPQIPSTSPF